MTWDAASHALIGLDLFDLLRRFDLLHFILRLQEEHWWPPLFGILSLPAYAIGGRRLSSPSLVSFASYCLIPVVAWLLIRQLTRVLPLLAAALVAIFFLRSPLFIEMSAWSMLEAAATLFALAAFSCFAARKRSWAYGFAGASTLLKYHYGFFLLVTLGVATFFELDVDERRALLTRARSWWIGTPLLLIAIGIVARNANVIWLGYIVALIAWIVKRPLLPPALHLFVTRGLIWPAIWCIDPANVHAWYRELFVSREAATTTFLRQWQTVARYLSHDFSLGPFVLMALGAGFLLALVEGVRRRNVSIIALTLHAMWPVALMSLSRYLIESRFLVTSIACLYASAVLGWILVLERCDLPLRVAIACALTGLLSFEQVRESDEWRAQLLRRRVYCYASSDPPDQFVRASVQAFTAGLPVLIALPGDVDVVAPTIRLGLRLAMPQVRPHDIVVEDTKNLAKRLRKFPGGMIGVEADATLRQRIAASGLKITGETRGPAIPERPGRALQVVLVSDNRARDSAPTSRK